MHVKHYKSNMHLSGKGVFVWGKCDSWFRLRMPRGWGCQAATKQNQEQAAAENVELLLRQ